MLYHLLIFVASLGEAALVLRWMHLETHSRQLRREVRHELAVQELMTVLQHQDDPQAPTVQMLRPRCCNAHKERFDRLCAEAKLRLAEED